MPPPDMFKNLCFKVFYPFFTFLEILHMRSHVRFHMRFHVRNFKHEIPSFAKVDITNRKKFNYQYKSLLFLIRFKIGSVHFVPCAIS